MTVLPTDAEAYTEEKVRSLAPPGSRVRKDFFNKRWEVYYSFPGPPKGPQVYKSASWGSRSMQDCAVIILRHAWQEAEVRGMKCPISGLLVVDAGSVKK